MARTKKSDQEKAEIKVRQQHALDFRTSGWSYRAIGEKLNISHEQARQDVEAALDALDDITDNKAKSYRQLELERLDKLQKALDPMASVGNPGAVNSLLRVMERRAKLLGLDAPEKKDINIKDLSKLSDDELRAIAEG